MIKSLSALSAISREAQWINRCSILQSACWRRPDNTKVEAFNWSGPNIPLEEMNREGQAERQPKEDILHCKSACGYQHSVCMWLSVFFQTAWQMTDCWHCDSDRITKKRKKNWNTLSGEESRCLLGLRDCFFWLNVHACVCEYNICMCGGCSHACVHTWEITCAGLDASKCITVKK